MKDDPILNIFLEPIRQQLGPHLTQVIQAITDYLVREGFLAHD